MARRRVRGGFGDYAGPEGAQYPSDEESVVTAGELMLSMCGNPGQESLIGDQLDNFSDWALAILEDEVSTRGSTFAEFGEMVREDWYDGRIDKWMGTDLIWARGWAKIAHQSGYHDAYDEIGEGSGQEFGV